ncbi:hypothetical protein [Plasticicumulans sp.]
MMYECGFRRAGHRCRQADRHGLGARALGPELAVFQTEVQQREHIEEIL